MGDFPGQVRPFFRPFLEQARFARRAVALRPAPLRPIGGGCGQGGDEGDDSGEEGRKIPGGEVHGRSIFRRERSASKLFWTQPGAAGGGGRPRAGRRLHCKGAGWWKGLGQSGSARRTRSTGYQEEGRRGISIAS